MDSEITQSKTVKSSSFLPLHYTLPHPYHQARLKTHQRKEEEDREVKWTIAQIKHTSASEGILYLKANNVFCEVGDKVIQCKLITRKPIMAFCHPPPNINIA